MQRRFGWLTGILTAAALVGALAPRAEGAEVKGRFELTLKVTGPAQLDVRTGAGDISVRTGSSSTVLVKAVVHVDSRSENGREQAEEILRSIQENPPIEQEGNSIRIGHERGSERMRHVSIDYDLEVPAGSDFTARSGSGDMDLGGPLAKVDVTAGSGDISVERVTGSLRLTTGSGDVRLKEAGGAGALVRTGSGDVEVGLPSQGGFNLVVATGSGDISSPSSGLSLEQIVSHRGMLQAKVRGGGADFTVQTGSGDVRIH